MIKHELIFLFKYSIKTAKWVTRYNNSARLEKKSRTPETENLSSFMQKAFQRQGRDD